MAGAIRLTIGAWFADAVIWRREGLRQWLRGRRGGEHRHALVFNAEK